MEYTIEQISKMKIVGIKTITDNKEGMALIPQLWGQFFNENTIETIENKMPSTKMYAIYTEYESDENGKYTFLLGAQVKDISTDEVNHASVTIPAGKYAVFTAANKDKVINVWQFVWQRTLDRNYKTDFEVYDVATEEVKIYVGLK
ncbi:MAG: AraC family transcriptional regulator [Desulfobacteraceae bacterium]|nr:AraC family transcriptional regulator [Desulfobacteraceae bacterium]